MIRISDLRHKDVINSGDGKRLGCIRDVDINAEEGFINALIIPGEGRLGFFGKSNYEDVIIPWSRIKKVGIDVILVEKDTSMPVDQKKNKNGFFFSGYGENDRHEQDSALPAAFANPLYGDDGFA
ncbi:MAG: YlmC/YmxH family sporulation protein [Firmicutes bacterium]|nr:YlmC/YmxH family sporulation protein [Bacillota bacterium]